MTHDLIPLGSRLPRYERQPRRSPLGGGAQSKWRRRGKRVLIEVAVLLGIGAVLLAGAVAWVNAEIARNVDSLGDPFANLPVRPPAPTPGPDGGAPVNILLLGSDSRIPEQGPSDWSGGDVHADTIMLLHLPADRERLYAMSIPRDTWVTVPGHGEGEISTAFALGGPSLLVQTIERLTGVRIDHMAVSDFEAFARLTDHVGGVTITIPGTTYDNRRGAVIPAGTYRMNGAEALDYVRQHGLPGDDLDRVQRQQNWLRALAREATEGGALDNLYEHTSILFLLSNSIAVDDGLTVARMRELALSARGIDQAEDMVFFTAPVAGFRPSTDGAPAVVLDQERLGEVSQAIVSDDLAAFLAENPGYVESLGTRVD